MTELIERFDDHQRRAIALLGDVIRALEPGMTARDVAAVADERRDAHGFDRWFHPPQVDLRCKVGRSLSRARLERGSLVAIDLAPATAEAFGDVGVTHPFGVDEPRIVELAREVVRATCGFASPRRTVGELYVFAKAWANNNRGSVLYGKGPIGHACIGPAPLLPGRYPQTAHWATLLRRNQVRMLNPGRLRGIWALRIPVTDGQRIAVFEEMIAVDESERRILGRDGIDGVGTVDPA